MQNMGVVIPAAGYGSLSESTCKLLEKVGNVPILVRVVCAVKAAGNFFPTVVVINHRFGEEIKRTLGQAGLRDVLFVQQSERRGAANAVSCALETLQSLDVANFLVILGEMLFMHPETIRTLVETHLKHSAHFSFLSCPFRSDNPLCSRMELHAFLMRDASAEHVGSPLLFMYSGHKPVDGADVIGSLYAFQTTWFAEHYSNLRPLDKRDGFGPEYHLPGFVEVAVLNVTTTVNLKLFRPLEMLGVNTQEELEFARQMAS